MSHAASEGGFERLIIWYNLLRLYTIIYIKLIACLKPSRFNNLMKYLWQFPVIKYYLFYMLSREICQLIIEKRIKDKRPRKGKTIFAKKLIFLSIEYD